MPATAAADEPRFRGAIAPVRCSSAYRACVALVALVSVLLPLAYVALIVAAVRAWWWWFTHGTVVFGTGRHHHGGRFELLAYLGPLTIGGLLLVFLLKPLFARAAERPAPVTLDPKREPRLFAFVARLCAAVGARAPARIDVDTRVNASAHFRDGGFGVLNGRLVLTLGLPLVATLDLRQLTGVLAHEFGHFAQGGAMRCAWIVFAVQRWFARAVYGRDRVDAWLEEAAAGAGGGIALVLHLARLLVWLTRRVLWLLMRWAGCSTRRCRGRWSSTRTCTRSARAAATRSRARCACCPCSTWPNAARGPT